MSTATCAERRNGDVAISYIAGALTPEENERYELHLLECAACQAEVRFAGGVAELAARRRAPRRAWIGGGALAAAAIAAVLVLAPRMGGADLQRLGALAEPPLYLGLPVRNDPGAADSLFASGMSAYAVENFGVAERDLRAALSAGIEPAPAEFFLAAALLMQDRPAEAAELYRRIVGYGDTPYLAEARYYGAKALLRQGAGTEASRELRLLADTDHEMAPAASALLDSVEAAVRR